jgi:hypothetical protein
MPLSALEAARKELEVCRVKLTEIHNALLRMGEDAPMDELERLEQLYEKYVEIEQHALEVIEDHMPKQRLYLACCGKRVLVGKHEVFGVRVDGPVFADGTEMKRCPKCNARVGPNDLRGKRTREQAKAIAAEEQPSLF